VRGCLTDVLPDVGLFFRTYDVPLFELASEYFSVWQGQRSFEWTQRIENERGMFVLMCFLARAVVIVKNSDAIVLQDDLVFVSIGLDRVLRECRSCKQGTVASWARRLRRHALHRVGHDGLLLTLDRHGRQFPQLEA